MASLSEQIDRFSRSTKSIKATATQTAVSRGQLKHSNIGVAGPFTRAILTTSLGDLIRDIDSSELGLFHLVGSSQGSNTEKDVPNFPSSLARVEFGSATPLKRVPMRRDESTKSHVEPEIYVHAAIKYIDRYGPIRQMPRARSQATSILRRLNDVRQNMRTLLQSLERINSEGLPSLKSLNQSEEGRSHEIRTEIASLRERRQTAMAQPKSTEVGTDESEAAHVHVTNTTFLSEGPSIVSAGRILHFADNLMDEAIDLNHPSLTDYIHTPEATGGDHPPSINNSCIMDQQCEKDEQPLDDVSQANPKTQIIDQATDIQIPQESSSPMDAAMKQGLPHEAPNVPAIASGYTTGNDGKIRMSGDLQYITKKIWQTAADIIGPPGRFNNLLDNTTQTPSVEQTFTRLTDLSRFEVSSAPASPASDISLTQPTAQQILTAHLLLTLLSAPHHSLPLNRVKEMLAAKAGGNVPSAGGQGTARVIYGCVAKRLLKIDRNGREQIVKFNM